MTKILIVDDEQKIREVVKEYALLNGYEVEEASDGLQALSMILDKTYDCIILDVMLPHMDGFKVLEEVRMVKNTPIIMLSARQEEYDILHGFNHGANDYVSKPFSPKELMARIKALLERNQKQVQVFKYKGLVVNFEGRSVTIDNEKINLTPKEIDLLIYMINNKNIALSRARLVEEIWQYDYSKDDRTIDTHIKMLRHSLREYRDLIVTVRGMGYKFEV